MQYFSCHYVWNYTWLHDLHDDQNRKCSDLNLANFQQSIKKISLFNVLTKNKLLSVKRKYLLINQAYERISDYIM